MKVLDLAAGLLFLFFLSKWLFAKKTSHPPGPPRFPIVGSALAMPKQYQWITFAEWQKTYGDLVYVEALGTPIVVLNKRADANALLDKKSDIYSDRPRLVMMGELCGSALTYAMSPLGDWYRKQKKIMAKALTPAASGRYCPLQEESAKRFVFDLLESKDVSTGHLHSHIDLAIARIIFLVLYGHEVKSADDECLSLFLGLLHNLSDISTKVWIVDILPFLKHIPKWTPGFSFHKVAAEHMKNTKAGSWKPYEAFKQQWESSGGNVIPSVCEAIFRDADGQLSKDSEEALVWGAHSLIGGGLDTSIASLHTFFLMMLNHPDVQKKAQAEVDCLGRLPTVDDKVNLPYVRGMITEILRCFPPIPLLLPHATTQADEYKGYSFDKGTMIFCNIWNMLRDPEDYPEPETFNPERYNGDDAAMQTVLTLIFGFGKRVCPGRRMAENTLFLFISTVLSMCDIVPVVDDDGKEFIPEIKFSGGMLPQPEPVKCKVRARKPLAMLS